MNHFAIYSDPQKRVARDAFKDHEHHLSQMIENFGKMGVKDCDLNQIKAFLLSDLETVRAMLAELDKQIKTVGDVQSN